MPKRTTYKRAAYPRKRKASSKSSSGKRKRTGTVKRTVKRRKVDQASLKKDVKKVVRKAMTCGKPQGHWKVIHGIDLILNYTHNGDVIINDRWNQRGSTLVQHFLMAPNNPFQIVDAVSVLFNNKTYDHNYANTTYLPENFDIKRTQLENLYCYSETKMTNFSDCDLEIVVWEITNKSNESSGFLGKFTSIYNTNVPWVNNGVMVPPNLNPHAPSGGSRFSREVDFSLYSSLKNLYNMKKKKMTIKRGESFSFKDSYRRDCVDIREWTIPGGDSLCLYPRGFKQYVICHEPALHYGYNSSGPLTSFGASRYAPDAEGRGLVGETKFVLKVSQPGNTPDEQEGDRFGKYTDPMVIPGGNTYQTIERSKDEVTLYSVQA